MKKKDNTVQVRLEAKRLYWEKKALFAQTRLQNNLELVKGNSGKLATNEVLDKLYTRVPHARAFIKWVAPSYGQDPETKVKVIHDNNSLYAQENTAPKKGIMGKLAKFAPVAGRLAKPYATKLLKKNAFKWGLAGARSLMLLPFKSRLKGKRRRLK